MAEILLFHHAQGLTAGCLAFADELRRARRLEERRQRDQRNKPDDLLAADTLVAQRASSCVVRSRIAIRE